jgi:hypothetical protein
MLRRSLRMLRRPNDERNAVDEKLQAGLGPGKDDSGQVSIVCRCASTRDACDAARNNLKYPSIMPQPQR